MPQIDFSTYASQIFWLFISFGLLYYIIARYALPLVRETLQNRQMRITSDLKKAADFKKEAETAQSDFTSSLEQAKQKAHDIINATRASMAQTAKEKHARLDERFAKQQSEADRRQDIIKREATEKMSEVSIQIAQSMIKKLINVDVDTAILQQLNSNQ